MYTSRFLLISYVGLILRSTTVVTQVAVPLRVLWGYSVATAFAVVSQPFVTAQTLGSVVTVASEYPHSTLNGTATWIATAILRNMRSNMSHKCKEKYSRSEKSGCVYTPVRNFQKLLQEYWATPENTCTLPTEGYIIYYILYIIYHILYIIYYIYIIYILYTYIYYIYIIYIIHIYIIHIIYYICYIYYIYYICYICYIYYIYYIYMYITYIIYIIYIIYTIRKYILYTLYVKNIWKKSWFPTTLEGAKSGNPTPL